ncbi:uncharacterized protein LOC106159584 [Lingula anatina]|uniref:Uncharacterized protein LOC106159584 n=1 Tax=Lingula anatina TaxID=7574 RepID=A0A1S3HZA2_LINAN|nr:uncharacterized protein LOC106159584 [Lingula anatina]|eukprot:XP_013391352.1 uncharacterized protein LOC106159584 [Lingula anatina]
MPSLNVLCNYLQRLHELLHPLGHCVSSDIPLAKRLTAVTGPCDPGYYCPEGSRRADSIICTAGYYCGQGTLDPMACPNGTFSNATGLSVVTQCTDCTEGYYCNGVALIEPSGPCSAGYYCPTGSSVETAVVCPIGQHCPQGSARPLDCVAGTYTDIEGAAVCQECPEGYYCIPEVVIPGSVNSIMTTCPEGFYCPNGTGHNWQACPAGTFSNVTNLRTAQECTPCMPGMHCQGINLTAPAGSCAEGYYCVSGADRANPLMLNESQCPTGTVHPVIGHECPAGFKCPAGSSYPVPCPAGMYQDSTAQGSCITCVAGYYCYGNTTDYAPNICPAGYYCEAGTPDPLHAPCPNGTYNNQTGMGNLTDCLSCPAGMYCDGQANEYPDGLCAAGWYCSNGSSDPRPSGDGGDICPAGTFCPLGSIAPQPCTAGQYCNSSGLGAPVADCDPGYYCPTGSSSPREVLCPVGHYCPTGSDLPDPCRNGTYNAGTGLAAQAECTPCDPGFYCNETGATGYSGVCAAGYYCPEAQTVPNPYATVCPRGHYCPVGSPVPVPCEMGYQQDAEGQALCDPCPEGFYCDNATITPAACPAGYYCPNGTRYGQEHPCPPGTFNNITGLMTSAQCQPCAPGFYCQRGGLAEPEGPCMAGYYCNGSTINPNPSEGICPIGNYCPEGSVWPEPCPSGTLASSAGNVNVSDCDPCPAGRYCTPESSQNGLTPPCDPGYVCLGGADNGQPNDGVMGYICPQGNYCPAGTITPQNCSMGTYAPVVELGECLSCPAGQTCPYIAMNYSLPCPEGYYCPNGTSDNGIPCPLGTYSNVTSLSVEGDCTPCPTGYFCNQTGLLAPAGPCNSGYYCIGGAMHQAPNDGVNEPCPLGSYCPEGTTQPIPCPRGTVNPNTGGRCLDDCMPCVGGMYCEDLNGTQFTGGCSEGYYCPGDVAIESRTPANYSCPAGFICPANSSIPTPCVNATYQPQEGQTFCLPCQAGHYCPVNASDMIPCPQYSYCPEGSVVPTLCPNGTYTTNSTQYLTDASQCLPCPEGSYCLAGQIAGLCNAGYICYNGSSTPTPTCDNATGVDNCPTGELCPYGYYCLAGCVEPSTCPPGTVINKVGAMSALECDVCPAGRICPSNSTLSQPCTRGFYCKFNATILPCPPNTYQPLEEATDESWCLPCPAGYWCHSYGMPDHTVSPCPPGYFCPEATWTPIPCPAGTYRDINTGGHIDDCFTCPAGYYCPDTNSTIAGVQCDEGYFCPNGSQNQTICQPGYYCNRSMTQKPCPPGYYCPEGSASMQPCPPGHYCQGRNECNDTDAGAIEPVLCPLGYKEKNNGQSPRQTFDDTCDPCPPGYYGAEPQRQNCTACQPGVVCHALATTDVPLSNDSAAFGYNTTNSYPCPIGYYCPEASSAPTACPNGTYNALEYMGNLTNCLPCPVDHFNHLTGQSGCFSCGGEARQPTVGQDTCLCTGQGRDFQSSDRQCPCGQGYVTLEGRSQDCVKKVYVLCTEVSTRSPDGRCLTESDWTEYCKEVCGEDDFVSVDPYLGLCSCKVDDLEAICDPECRYKQRFTLSMVCPALPEKPYIAVTDPADGSVKVKIPTTSMTTIVNSRNSISADQCGALDGTQSPIHMCEFSGDGINGIYSPNPDYVTNLLVSNSKDFTYNSNTTYSSGGTLRRLLTVSNGTGYEFTGIRQPTVCLLYGETMMMAVTNENYPVYDRNNLYNTNEKFDYGGFRQLAEAMSQAESLSTLFSYKFTDPGVYVFYLSSNINKKMYVKVMAKDAQCSEDGPFFPTTPRYVIQNGIALEQDILKSPDWVLIAILLASVLVLMTIIVIALVLFRKYGWNKASFIFPKYRSLAVKYNLEDYASKGSSVHPVKKYNRNIEAMPDTAATYPMITDGDNQSLVLHTGAEKVKEDEFWDYDHQVDLEAFSTPELYDTLAKQSYEVTKQLGRQKEEAKSLFQKLNNQALSLKGLWAAKLNLKGGSSALATKEDLAAYERKLEELEIELERRRELGSRFQTILERQINLQEQDEKSREEHQVSFQTAMREAMRLLNEHSEKLQRGQVIKDGAFDEELHRSVGARVGALVQRMSAEVSKECMRLGSWGVLGQGTGGQMVAKDTKEPLSRQDLIDSDSNILAPELIHMNPETGLIIPNSDAQMLLASGQVVDIPHDHFVHPQTGRVLPIAGNVAFDPVSTRLVFTTDSATGEATRTDEPLIPYVPYPTNPSTGLPVPTKLVPLQCRSDMKYGAPVPDPTSGLHVPITAMTINPQTGTVLPVGGSHIDPVTGLPIAIEIGSLMLDPQTEQPVPILATTIDPETGDIIPVGGTRPGSQGGDIPIIPGDSFVEPLSGKMCRVNGGTLKENMVAVACAGGYQALLDANVLACEVRALDSVRELKDIVTGPEAADGSTPFNPRHEETMLEASLKEMNKARTRMKTHLLRTGHDIYRRYDRATVLASTGGSPGMYQFTATGQLLPILIGTSMQDPSGSGVEVPILAADKDKTGVIIPLGGTMEDPEGEGSVPIMIGRQAVDTVTGELSPISGVRIDPETNTVVPITLSSGGHKKRRPPLGAVAMLEEEIVARRGFWRRQRQREETLTMQEFHLAQHLMHNMESLTAKEVENTLASVSESTYELSESASREVQRRKDAEEELSTVLPPNVVAVLTQGDQYEREREEAHHSAHKKFVEATQKFLKKLEAEEQKFHTRMADLEGAMNPDAENVVRQRHVQAKARLQAELYDQIMNRSEQLDQQHSSLEYTRERNELLCQEAKVVLTGLAVLAGDYDCTLPGVYGEMDLTSSSSDRELVPLLKQLISMLESGGPFVLTSEMLNLLGGNITNLNINRAAAARPPAAGAEGGQSKRDHPPTPKVERAHLVQSGAPTTPATGLSGSTTNFSSMVNQGALKKPPGELSEEEKARLQKQLFDKQAYEAAKLENSLRDEEIKNINEVIAEVETKKQNAMEDAKKNLSKQLSKATTDAEREKIMLEYANNLQKINDALEKQKQQQLESLRKKLLEQRRKAKKDLHRTHINEARELGLSPDVVPDMTIPSYDDLDKDLRLLAQQQERLLAEIAKADAEAEENARELDVDIEARLKSLHIGGVPDADGAVKQMKEKSSQTKSMQSALKDKLKNRKGRRNARKSMDMDEIKNLSEEEKKKLEEAQNIQTEADRLREENAVMEALRRLEEDSNKRAEEEEVKKRLQEMNEEERKKIMQQYEEDCMNVGHRMTASRAKQRDSLLAKLTARKQMKEDLAKERAVAKELDRITKAQAARGDEETAEVIIEISDQLNGDHLSKEAQQLQSQQIDQQSSLIEKQKMEEREMEMELDNELRKTKEAVDLQIDQQKRLAVENMQAKHEREMQLHGKKLSEDEVERLLAIHKQEVEAFERNLDQERARQKKSLEDKVMERKRQKADRLAEKHSIEMNRVLMQQQQDRDKLNSTQAKGVENTTLKESVKDKDGQQAENMVYTVLRQRHMKEGIHLEDQLEKERAAMLAQARAQMEEQRQGEREKLMAAFEQELMDLIANSASLKNGELQEKKEELKRQQQRILGEFDLLTPQLVKQEEKDADRLADIKSTNERLALKERQLRELAEAMRNLTAEEKLMKEYEEEAKRAAEEMIKFKEDSLRKMQEEMEKMKADKLRQEEEKKRMMAEKLRQMEEDLEADKKREEEREKQRAAERERVHKKQMEERDQRRRQEIATMETSEEEKERLLREHKENMEKFDQSLKKEQERSKSALQAKLEARRNKQKASQSAMLEKDIQLEQEEEYKRELKRKMEEEALRNKDEEGGMGQHTPGQQSGHMPFMPTGNAEQDWVNMLMASPLFQQISDLENLLDKTVGAGPANKVIGADYSRSYLDVKDAQWVCKGDLVPVDINDISASQFVVYRFGVFINRMLHQLVDAPDVTLLLASNLPPNNYEFNAFRNSFFYEHARKILFIRAERLESVGDFIVVILHCLAHIKVGDLADDTNPLFLRQFYKSMRAVCQDMFFARSRSTTNAESLIGSGSGRTALEKAFKHAKTPDQKANVFGELVEQKMTGNVDFSDKTMSNRIQGYEAFSGNAQLRQVLASKGGIAASGDFIADRLTELRGKKGNRSKTDRKGMFKQRHLDSHQDLVESQLKHLQDRCDTLNAELAQVMKSAADLEEGIKKHEDSGDGQRLDTLKQQLATVQQRRDLLMKKVAHIETDIAKKKQDLTTAKNM